MEFDDSEEEGFTINTFLEIRIENLHSNEKMVVNTPKKQHSHRDFEVAFSASVFVGETFIYTQDCLEVCLKYEKNKEIVFHDTDLSWMLSIIDINGNCKSTRSFNPHANNVYVKWSGDLVDGELSTEKYLKRSFILSRAEEFLPEGVLTLRLDISMSCAEVSPNYLPWDMRERQKMSFDDFFLSVPHKVSSKKDDETGDSRIPEIRKTVFDFTPKIPTLPGLGSLDSEYKRDNKDILKHVWIFEAHPDSFVLSLDPRKDSVGLRLLQDSSLIRECVEVDLKREQENRIKLPNVSSETFKAVLYFLETSSCPDFDYHKTLCLYKFCHLYEIEDLQKLLAESLVWKIKPKGFDVKELEEIASLYSDANLSNFLQTVPSADEITYISSPTRLSSSIKNAMFS